MSSCSSSEENINLTMATNGWSAPSSVVHQRYASYHGLFCGLSVTRSTNCESTVFQHLSSFTRYQIREVLTAPRSPWQNAHVERLIGSIRRDCLDHVLILNERGLRRILRSYFAYYERSRTHLGLAKDAPVPRSVQTAISWKSD